MLKRNFVVVLGMLACACAHQACADEAEQSREKFLTVSAQLEDIVDEEEGIAVDQETNREPEDFVCDQDHLHEEESLADRGEERDQLIAKTCAEGKCPSEMIERLREQKRRERGEVIEKETSYEELEIPEAVERSLVA